MSFRLILKAMFIVVFAGFLSACDSSDERAEKYYQSALSFLEAGDESRAIVEFKNVFKVNSKHREARSKFAELQRKRGNIRGAVSQYLRLVEQYPDDFDGHLAIAEIYAENDNWAEMGHYLGQATKIQPENPTVQALQLVFDYRKAIEDQNQDGLKAIIVKTSDLISAMPENNLLRQLLIDDHIRSSNFELARDEIDLAIVQAPDDRRLYTARLFVLASLEDAFGIETQLKEMIVKFPDDETSRVSLVRWYVSQGQLDEAESYLREDAEREGAVSESKLTLVRFLSQFRGQDVALNELNTIIERGDTSPLILGLRAGFEFDRGNHDIAIQQMRETIEGLEATEDARRVKTALSQMLVSTGNIVGARALVEEVLEEDSLNVPALKLKANWLIDDDKVTEAIVALRAALDQAPRDADILTILARAHGRDGNQDLVGEMLALALDASNGAPDESIRYAKFLMSLEKFTTAEGILVDSLRLSPGHVGILTELGNLYVSTEDWPRADQVQATMRRTELPEGITGANELQARILNGQQKLNETVDFLQGLVSQGEAGFGANIEIVRSYLATGETDKAKQYVADLLATDPTNAAVRFLDASVDLATGNPDNAESKFRALVEEDEKRVQIWVALYRMMLDTNRSDDAAAIVKEARLALPDDPTLKWIKAGLLEGEGDLPGAIAIYEEMYAVDSDNLVIANNLASLLSIVNTDPATVERATIIAKRLRSSRVPPYQDTYGWIAHLRGETAEAIEALEPAARALNQDPLVQYHLAQAYLAASNTDGALKQFEKVVELTSAADTRDFVETAREEINRLKSGQN